MGKDIHEEIFDETTITKLEIFEAYVEAWLPVFLYSRHFPEIHIFDFFAGSGHDPLKTPGSPLRFLEKVLSFKSDIISNRTRVYLHLNELKKNKFENLVSSCTSFLADNNMNSDFIRIKYYNEDIEELFPKLLPVINKFPSLVYLDQNGVKFLNDNFLLPLTSCKQTDFIYFVSSQHAKRFGQLKEFQNYLKIDIDELKKVDNSKVHQTLTKLIRERIPKKSRCNLYPFSLKKQNNHNIYGIIFGATHLLAVDKFLKIAWQTNGINGNANFDIEDENNPQVVLDFFGEGKTIKKVDKFKQDLRRKVLDGEIVNNQDVLAFCYRQGHISQHGTDCIREMKKKNEIYYDGQPLISYNSIHKENRLKHYKLLTNG